MAPLSSHLQHQLPSLRAADLAHRMAILHQLESAPDSQSSMPSEVRCRAVVSDEFSLMRSALDQVNRLSFTEMHSRMLAGRGQDVAKSADEQQVGRLELFGLAKPASVNHGLEARFRMQIAQDLPTHSICPHEAIAKADLKEVESPDYSETPQDVGIQDKKIRHV